MKKFITAVLAIIMAGTMSVTTFAASPITASGGTDSCEVTGIYVNEKKDTIKLDITWGDMVFVYRDTNETWDTGTHEWKSTGSPAWELDEGSSNKIELKNHSSCGMYVAFSFAPTSAFPRINGDFKDKTQATLTYDADYNEYTTEMAAATTTGPSTFDAYFMPNAGALTNSGNKSDTIGTITVTIDSLTTLE